VTIEQRLDEMCNDLAQEIGDRAIACAVTREIAKLVADAVAEERGRWRAKVRRVRELRNDYHRVHPASCAEEQALHAGVDVLDTALAILSADKDAESKS